MRPRGRSGTLAKRAVHETRVVNVRVDRHPEQRIAGGRHRDQLQRRGRPTLETRDEPSRNRHRSAGAEHQHERVCAPVAVSLDDRRGVLRPSSAAGPRIAETRSVPATIRGLRISVAHVVNLLANGLTPAQVVEELPDLDDEDIRQALAYAAALAKDELHLIRG